MPQQLAILHRQPHHTRGRDDENLSNAADRGEHGRGIRGLVAQRLPDRIAGLLVVRDDRISARPARQHDDLVVDDEGRRRHAPAQVRGVVIGQDVATPHERALCRIQHAQLTFGAKRVDSTLVIGGRRARAVSAHRLLKTCRPRVGPQFASRLHVVRGNDFLVAALLDRESSTVCNNERGVPAANGLLPHRTQPFARPGCTNRRRCVSSIPIGSTEVGPTVIRCVGLVHRSVGRRRRGGGCVGCIGYVGCVRCDRCGCALGTRLRDRRGGGRADLALMSPVGLERGIVRSHDEARPAAAAALKTKAGGCQAGNDEHNAKQQDSQFSHHLSMTLVAVDGQWAKDDRRWTMDDGRWTIDDGRSRCDRDAGSRRSDRTSPTPEGDGCGWPQRARVGIHPRNPATPKLSSSGWAYMYRRFRCNI